jgi:hypothetical protein
MSGAAVSTKSSPLLQQQKQQANRPLIRPAGVARRAASPESEMRVGGAVARRAASPESEVRLDDWELGECIHYTKVFRRRMGRHQHNVSTAWPVPDTRHLVGQLHRAIPDVSDGPAHARHHRLRLHRPLQCQPQLR